MTNWIIKQFGIEFLIRLMGFWPPYFGAGVRIRKIEKNLAFIRVSMKQYFWNTNVIGSHFGGSLYSMTDPFFMLMLQFKLGEQYRVIDRRASIEYLKIAKGEVWSEFSIPDDIINEIIQKLSNTDNMEYTFKTTIVNDECTLANIEKTLYIKRR